MERGSKVPEKSWADRLDLGPVPAPCPCDFFHKGYVCGWHVICTDEEWAEATAHWDEVDEKH